MCLHFVRARMGTGLGAGKVANAAYGPTREHNADLGKRLAASRKPRKWHLQIPVGWLATRK